eukprot:898982-Rhodomonas_salina.2
MKAKMVPVTTTTPGRRTACVRAGDRTVNAQDVRGDVTLPIRVTIRFLPLAGSHDHDNHGREHEEEHGLHQIFPPHVEDREGVQVDPKRLRHGFCPAFSPSNGNQAVKTSHPSDQLLPSSSPRLSPAVRSQC